MAALAGKAGKVILTAATIVNVNSWSVDISIDLADITSLGDSWKEQLPTLKEWSGTIECHFDPADTTGQNALRTAALAGTQVALQFYVDGTYYYSGNAYIASQGVETPVDDKVSISFEFTGDGALTYN